MNKPSVRKSNSNKSQMKISSFFIPGKKSILQLKSNDKNNDCTSKGKNLLENPINKDTESTSNKKLNDITNKNNVLEEKSNSSNSLDAVIVEKESSLIKCLKITERNKRKREISPLHEEDKNIIPGSPQTNKSTSFSKLNKLNKIFASDNVISKKVDKLKNSIDRNMKEETLFSPVKIRKLSENKNKPNDHSSGKGDKMLLHCKYSSENNISSKTFIDLTGDDTEYCEDGNTNSTYFQSRKSWPFTKTKWSEELMQSWVNNGDYSSVLKNIKKNIQIDNKEISVINKNIECSSSDNKIQNKTFKNVSTENIINNLSSEEDFLEKLISDTKDLTKPLSRNKNVKPVNKKNNSYIKIKLNSSSDNLLLKETFKYIEPASKIENDTIKEVNKSTKYDLNVKNKKINNTSENIKLVPEKTKIDNTSLIDNMFNDEWNFDDSNSIIQEIFDLETWQTCNIISVESINNLKILQLKSTKSDQRATCYLKESWSRCLVDVGDTVNVKGVKVDDHYVIDNTKGMLVSSPDTLVSSTTIVGSVFCRRKAILAELYRGIDGSADIMVIGSIGHQILQQVLNKKLYSEIEIKTLIETYIYLPENVSQMYDNKMSVDDTRKRLFEFIPQILHFVDNYIEKPKYNFQKKNNLKQNNWTGSIDEILDIEENIWLPTLGLKGKIDMTVKTQPGNKLMAFELKTGRSSMSVEHRGQVALYVMMLVHLGFDVESGLLFYLTDGTLKELKPSLHEKRDLLLLRNEVAYYLTRKPKIIEVPKTCDDSSTNIQIELAKYPNPVNKPFCKKCPYGTVCTVILSQEKDVHLPEEHYLRQLKSELMGHLSKEHIDYFIHWSTGVIFETSTITKPISDIWMLKPLEREKLGKSLTYVTIKGSIIEKDDRYLTTFIYKEFIEGCDMRKTDFSVSDYVVISIDERPSLASGLIENITKYTITVSLERNLTERYNNSLFHIDAFDSSRFRTLNLSNIARLMENTEKSRKLREIIIDKTPCIIDENIHPKVAAAAKEVLRDLNSLQKRAALTSMAVKNYYLINGMPGTGKTSTIVALIKMIMKLEKSVLITSHTNSAIDNVLMKLEEPSNSKRILRLGRSGRINPILNPFSEKCLSAKTPEDLEFCYNRPLVVGVTCLNSTHPLLSQRKFDFCIMDESTQIFQPSSLKPLFSADKFVLVGDPNQLPPVIINSNAKLMKLEETIFDRLFTPSNSISLSLQYRMNECITTLANHLTYDGKLLCANDKVKNAVMSLPDKNCSMYQKQIKKKWLEETCSQNMEKSVVFLDTGNTFEKCQELTKERFLIPVLHNKKMYQLCSNICEAAVIFSIISTLIEGGAKLENIGVMAPFRIQVELLKRLLHTFNSIDCIEVNTVDQYQGRDKRIIIYSSTRSGGVANVNSTTDTGILNDHRRLTVAVTRAKHKLIIVGDRSTLIAYKPFKKMFEFFKPSQIVDLENPFSSIDWELELSKIEPVYKKMYS